MIGQYILFVEDDKSVQRNVVKMLQDEFADYKVDTASSVQGAINKLRKHRRSHGVTRVVIVDEELAGQGRGSDLLAYMHKKYPGIRKIMLAANENLDDLSKAVNHGNLDKYIRKRDFKKNHILLFDTIRQLLEKDRGFIYNAIVEVMQKAEEEQAGDQLIRVAVGRKLMRPSDLLRHIMDETELGQEHMKQFSKFLYNAFLHPDDCLKEMSRRMKPKKKAKAKGRGKKTTKTKTKRAKSQ